jgi:hypothetical protein|tara:strand:+ start:196 stop:888 length:693 start_codon:yes stop_codon:yes gene_type:complete
VVLDVRIARIFQNGKRVLQNMNIKENIVLSSCRLGRLQHNSYTHKLLHTHSTKEVLQYLNYISGKINIPREMERYIFRGVFLTASKKASVVKCKKEFDNCRNVLIEICSKKIYISKEFYIHHLAAEKNNKKNPKKIPAEIKIQEINEIESDLVKIKNILSTKNLLVVTHTEYAQAKARTEFIQSVEDICRKNNIKCFNPSKYNMKDYMIDSAHFNRTGLELMAEHISGYI